MVQSVITPQTAQRWQTALDKAIRNALDVLVDTTGAAYVESSSTPGLIYSVSREHCTCPAGENGQPCQHRAAYLAQCGLLPLDPEPEGVQLVCENGDRFAVLIDGEVYGDAVATEHGGWELFRGRFPHARRIGSYCSLDEIERDLTARMPLALPLAPSSWTVDMSGALAAA